LSQRFRNYIKSHIHFGGRELLACGSRKRHCYRE
jgi:hypothetical protein